jgi:hypothetical protein
MNSSLAAPPNRRRVRTALLFLGALVFLFEEWTWVCFTRFFAWLGRMGLLRWLDARLTRLAPAAALFVLCVPIALLFPVKIAGLWMIASGQFLSGCAVMLAAKIASTAIVARIFLTCRPQLLRMPWFARLHNLTLALRDRVHLWLEQQAGWQDAKGLIRAIRRHARAWVRGRRVGDYDRELRRRGVLRRWRSRRRSSMSAGLPQQAGNEGEGR